MSKLNTITISGELASELEAWGKLTARLFSKVRRQAADDRVFKPITTKLIPPKSIPKDQAWFWSNLWQQGEQAVNVSLKNSEYDTFQSADELIEDLHRHV